MVCYFVSFFCDEHCFNLILSWARSNLGRQMNTALDFGEEPELDEPQFVQVEVAGPDEQQFIVYTE